LAGVTLLKRYTNDNTTGHYQHTSVHQEEYFAQCFSLFATVNYAQIKCSTNSEILFLQV